jgi:hypothetical protein
MTAAAEASFLTTLIPVFLGGVVSSLLTLLLGQPLQHHFWRRQQYTQRQFAVIDGLNSWAAEVEYYFVTQRFSSGSNDFYKTLVMLSGSMRTLFSVRAVEQCQALHAVMREGLAATDPEHRTQIWQQFQEAHRDAIKALYQDMRIPPRWLPWLRIRRS